VRSDVPGSPLPGGVPPGTTQPADSIFRSLLEPMKHNEDAFLVGRRDRGEELASSIRIFMEFLHGVDGMQMVDRPCVTVFGSARFRRESPWYELARATGRALAQAGFAVMTGGGPGLMEAANRGAQEAGGLSLGCSIRLPYEEDANPFVDHLVGFDHFFVRKVMLVKYSQAFVMMPGGFGTLDEMFETLTLIQTGKIRRFPVVAMGSDFWRHLQLFIEEGLAANGAISPGDADILRVTDAPDEAVAIIKAVWER
jgi:uncharacterized protein (TIGR00730 family)